VMGWQPIETAPVDGTRFLTWDGHWHDVCGLGWYDGDKPIWYNGDVSVDATHWMPLPAAPTSAGAA
jgi:hypothetical protein